jgi:hypothetical protein
MRGSIAASVTESARATLLRRGYEAFNRGEMDETVFHLWILADGRAVRFEVHLDREEAMAALGGEGS